MANPLNKIITTDIGRGNQLKNGPGNNQYARASDFNPVVDYLNNRAPINATTGTAGNSATINSNVGELTTGTLTTASGSTQAITITNSSIVATSMVFVQVAAYSGTLATNGYPVVTKVVPAAGSVVISITNVHGANALSGTVKLRFLVF